MTNSLDPFRFLLMAVSGYQRIWLIPVLLLTLIVTLIAGPPILSDGYTMFNASLLAAPALYCWSIKSFGARHAHS
jgi:predicted metal-binding membrane protein